MPGSRHDSDLLTVQQFASPAVKQMRIVKRKDAPDLKGIARRMRAGVVAPCLKDGLY
jgi:hypothetical protein